MSLSLRAVFPLIIALFFSLFCNCGYCGLLSKSVTLSTTSKIIPSVEKSRITTPEKCMTVYGQVQASDTIHHPIAVVALSYRFGRAEVVDNAQLYRPGYFLLYLPEGEYQIYVFEDLNENHQFESSECVGYYTKAPVLSVVKTNQRRVLGPVLLTISEKIVTNLGIPLTLPAKNLESIAQSHWFPSGTIRPLSDPIFDGKNGALGLYEPATFLEHAGGYLYALQEHDTNKIPIIFVHGVGGTPRDFNYIVNHIDRKKYEPLFFYYPSGERLDMVADILYEIFLSQKVFDMKGRKVVICAHSMGGIVSRAAINKYVADGHEDFLKAFITIATPFGGNDAAANGIKQAPVVVPSWKDVASGSPFVNQLYKTKLPPTIPFYLLFAYRSPENVNIGSNSDGTIALKSQLDQRAESSAASVSGFNETHTSILSSRECSEKLNTILKGI